ncbi:MAG: phosphoribosylformylglycinamidine synthase [Chitinispirillaceae bacterium]|nr:phosphoribosylformylglycinamidine synthase [Chitinispirillaceae bacterium]
MPGVKRVFVEKKEGLDIAAKGLWEDLRDNLCIKGITGVRLVNRYDIEGITDREYASARDIVFAEPPVDHVYDEELPVRADERLFAVEYLPGQYDQRADSAAQCIQIITQGNRPAVASAQVVLVKGAINDADFLALKKYCINPVDSREASIEKPATLSLKLETPSDVPVIEGFRHKKKSGLERLRFDLGLAMRHEDLAFCQEYFRDTEKRDPTLTEIRMLDTYWSDHCRHTTFLSEISGVKIAPSVYTKPVVSAYDAYRASRKYVYRGKKPKTMCLMDIATIGMKELGMKGLLDDLDTSDEINACSIVVKALIDGKEEPWLVMFKNETHNHPTEIEPFGGAATCLGGAIRDPLSGRSYVYHAMRVTGSGDPRKKAEETPAGKLPQRKITTLAAQGYSSYGNQIGLATGMVSEVYDEGFVAKRMEIGVVIGAVPAANVRREAPAAGDLVLLVGGRTGRDGCGGATGSSKAHDEESILTCGAEVQKGNAPTERKIQRLFRDPEVTRMIKRCNDFGAGGVSVAIGELAAGLDIELDAVPKKYEGLDGTELAISESQERMAVVIGEKDLGRFEKAVANENLEMAVVARVTDARRLRMAWRGKTIVDLSREFIDTNGVRQKSSIMVAAPDACGNFFRRPLPEARNRGGTLKEKWLALMEDLDVCCQRGLVERFDSTIGAASVLLPFGGKYQSTPIECMVAKLPIIKGETITGTAMSWGYLPRLSFWSPFHGALYAVIDAAAKIVAAGGNHHTIRLTLQEYFEKLGTDRKKWGKPFAALLGAFTAQRSLGIAAIGGKDSMSGSFKDIAVPPTLVAFALTAVDVRKIISPEFKGPGRSVVLLPLPRDKAEMPDFKKLDKMFSAVHRAIGKGAVSAAHSVRSGGIAEAVAKMSFGNRIGLTLDKSFDLRGLFSPDIGSLVVEMNVGNPGMHFRGVEHVTLGRTSPESVIRAGHETLTIEDLQRRWEMPLEKVFPTKVPRASVKCESADFTGMGIRRSGPRIARPRVCITVFPGTNCEYDSMRAFARAGAEPHFFIMKNLTAADIDESIRRIVKQIKESQILMIPGGFSAGDEPDGSGKFIAAFFRHPHVKDAVDDLLHKRDGLIIGICNGFQALIKLGLVPFGSITAMEPASPTLTFNTIGRHISRMAYTRVASVKSPWFAGVHVGDIHAVPISHGEGRFVAPGPHIARLLKNGQVATRYTDPDGNLLDDDDGNPNGSHGAIESITSPDGRVVGKMGHSERRSEFTAKNICGNKDQKLFESGVRYFL